MTLHGDFKALALLAHWYGQFKIIVIFMLRINNKTITNRKQSCGQNNQGNRIWMYSGACDAWQIMFVFEHLNFNPQRQNKMPSTDYDA
ncbi:hypothetical protein [Desulfosarcina ovata]|uniref:hypothetical protein n=1 Tax=Desulfosarcina ovata TaxID=83564 RepID=UPI0012D2CA6F|nr:hypothetical protein [Desulfosarcina ovata]